MYIRSVEASSGQVSQLGQCSSAYTCLLKHATYSSYTELVGYTAQPYSEQASQLSIQAQPSLKEIMPNECQAIFAIVHVQIPYASFSAAAIATCIPSKLQLDAAIACSLRLLYRK